MTKKKILQEIHEIQETKTTVEEKVISIDIDMVFLVLITNYGTLHVYKKNSQNSFMSDPMFVKIY